jgi:hypothetical protein
MIAKIPFTKRCLAIIISILLYQKVTMMRIWLITLIACSVLNASSITAPLLEVEGERATIVVENLREGMSGFIVRKFDAAHSTIIANAQR